MEMIRERTSFTFDSRDMLLSVQSGFSLERIAVACAILERTSGLTYHLNNCSEVLEACHGIQLLPFNLELPLVAIFAVCHQFGLLSTDPDIISCADFAETFN